MKCVMNKLIKSSNIYLFTFVFAFILSKSFVVFANDEPSPDIPEGIVKISKINPDRNVGYLMGDILNRTITLDVKKPYKLIETSLPIVGYEHRYQGQVSGIELCKISHTKKENDDKTSYVIHLSYQIFTTAPVVKPAILPAEVIKFQGPASAEAKDGLVQYKIPEFYFRISPMAVFGAVKIEDDMSPLRQPILLQAYPEKEKLVASLILLGLSLVGLLYSLGSRAWLPVMGRPFAQAGRHLRGLSATNTDDLKTALTCLHKAINSTAKYSVFSDNVSDFLTHSPSFKVIENELGQFFELSHKVFFDTQDTSAHDKNSLVWLKRFCKQCRDCERGLKPANLKKI